MICNIWRDINEETSVAIKFGIAEKIVYFDNNK